MTLYSYLLHYTEYYSNDTNVKKAYSMALRKGQAQIIDARVQVVGAENSGKTCLISSFLGEEFVEGQAATAGVDVEVCKVYCTNWIRSSHDDKINYLGNEFAEHSKGNALKYMIMQATMNLDQRATTQQVVAFPSPPVVEHKIVFKETVNTFLTNHAPTDDLHKNKPQGVDRDQVAKQYDLIAVFWDFAGQTIFHNSHSMFISDNSVIMITFDASMKLKDEVIPRESSHRPPECHSVISSIHYWLQVVYSLCSVKKNVLLVGTHIDKLHSDINKAREIAKQIILPTLIEELHDKPYVRHLAGDCNEHDFNPHLYAFHHHLYGFYQHISRFEIEQCCFFLSNKCRDEEIRHLKVKAMKVYSTLQEKQPLYFLKIEQALMQQKEPVISKAMILDLVIKSTFKLAKNSSEFEGIIRYFHNKRTILNFGKTESLKDIVILSPRWLAKLFSYVIAADTFEIGTNPDVNAAQKRFKKSGILHEILLQHMLDKFHSDHPVVIQVTKQQVVDILLCFHLIAPITEKAWFIEEGYFSLPTANCGDTFIVPCLVPQEHNKNFKIIHNTKQERIVYFQFQSGFVPLSILNQLIANFVSAVMYKETVLCCGE